MTLASAAQALVKRLAAADRRLVLAESCTGGMVASTLAGVPGVSQWLCGSAVTYREATKAAWLGTAPDLIERFTAVSQPVTEAMARQALLRTPEADLAVAVTGHLGPDAPAELDGLVWIAAAWQADDQTRTDTISVRLQEHERVDRQREATAAVLKHATGLLAEHFSYR